MSSSANSSTSSGSPPAAARAVLLVHPQGLTARMRGPRQQRLHVPRHCEPSPGPQRDAAPWRCLSTNNAVCDHGRQGFVLIGAAVPARGSPTRWRVFSPGGEEEADRDRAADGRRARYSSLLNKHWKESKDISPAKRNSRLCWAHRRSVKMVTTGSLIKLEHIPPMFSAGCRRNTSARLARDCLRTGRQRKGFPNTPVVIGRNLRAAARTRRIVRERLKLVRHINKLPLTYLGCDTGRLYEDSHHA